MALARSVSPHKRRNLRVCRPRFATQFDQCARSLPAKTSFPINYHAFPENPLRKKHNAYKTCSKPYGKTVFLIFAALLLISAQACALLPSRFHWNKIYNSQDHFASHLPPLQCKNSQEDEFTTRATNLDPSVPNSNFSVSNLPNSSPTLLNTKIRLYSHHYQAASRFPRKNCLKQPVISLCDSYLLSFPSFPDNSEKMVWSKPFPNVTVSGWNPRSLTFE